MRALRPPGTTLARRAEPPGDRIEDLAREAGIHPELARRLIRIGFLDPVAPGADRWARAEAWRLARAVRLRRDLGLNYAGALMVTELLDRIDELEGRLRPYEEVRWTRAS